MLIFTGMLAVPLSRAADKLDKPTLISTHSHPLSRFCGRPRLLGQPPMPMAVAAQATPYAARIRDGSGVRLGLACLARW
jgi:hypothetical protein